jgi:hypothetical protein
MRTAFWRLSAGALALAASPTAPALDFDLGALSVGFDSNMAIGAALRLKHPDAALVARANGGEAFSTNHDDGTLAFERGNLAGAVTKLASSMTIEFGGIGFFLRGNYIYNPVLMGKSLFDSADYLPNPGKEVGLDELNRKQSQVRSAAGSNLAVQDAYLALDYRLFERPLSMRLGRQSVYWGGTRLLSSGLQSLQAIDRNRLRVPGADSDDVRIPVNQAWLDTRLTERLQLEVFYQFEWRPTELDAAGTFWSVNDYLGAGGTRFNLGFGRAGENSNSSTICVAPPPGGSSCVPFGSAVPRAADREPADSGQYGGRLRMELPGLNDVGLSLAYASFHSRLPLVSATSRLSSLSPVGTASYFAEYPEAIRMRGLGVDVPVDAFDASVRLDYAYTTGQPLQIDDTELHLAILGSPSQFNPVSGGTLGQQYLQGWRRHKLSEASVSVLRLFGPRLGYDMLTVLVEAGGVFVHDLPDAAVLRYEGPATYTPGDATQAENRSLPQQTDGYATAQSWGYGALLMLSFSNVLDLALFEPSVRFRHDLKGITPQPLGHYISGRREAGLALDMTFARSWTAQLGYTNYFGAGVQNLLSDRDHVHAHLKYSF